MTPGKEIRKVKEVGVQLRLRMAESSREPTDVSNGQGNGRPFSELGERKKKSDVSGSAEKEEGNRKDCLLKK